MSDTTVALDNNLCAVFNSPERTLSDDEKDETKRCSIESDAGLDAIRQRLLWRSKLQRAAAARRRFEFSRKLVQSVAEAGEEKELDTAIY